VDEQTRLPRSGSGSTPANRPRLALPPITSVGWVAAGGAAGGLLRFGFNELADHGRWATLAENVIGAFLLGALLMVLLGTRPMAPATRPLLATGALGSFTTFSTYTVEVALLVDGGHPLAAAVYGLGSLAAGLVAGLAGIAVGRLPSRRPA
jgi:fluoride exporter